jgi:hypothetical protein
MHRTHAHATAMLMSAPAERKITMLMSQRLMAGGDAVA